ncbi:MAG: ankyrin repeat domain-containing protein [Rickettsiales bacterium]|jgi:hypothetical protein|nr:ankyrin repeat domain-containing protein [Rickettsiales bacterium]
MFIKKISFFAAFFAALSSGAKAAAPGTDFQVAAQLLRAARAGDINMVERLVNSGANVNYVDGTGLSIVCTAIMNNDLKAAQILQIYGADASRCDMQIRRHQSGLPKEGGGGVFSGLSNAQNMTLAAGAVGLAVGGVYILGDDLFGIGGGRSSGATGSGQGGGGGGNTGGGTVGDLRITVPQSPTPSEGNFWSTGPNQAGWDFMKTGTIVDAPVIWHIPNYLYMTGGYAALGRQYTGQVTFRNVETGALLSLTSGLVGQVDGMAPVPVALITANGIKNPGANGSENKASTAGNREIKYATACSVSQAGVVSNCIPAITNRYKNIDGGGLEIALNYDWSGSGTVFNENATALDTLLAQIIVGQAGSYGADETPANVDFIGFMPSGQIALYRTGGGKKMKTLDVSDQIVIGTVTGGTDGFGDGSEFIIDGVTYGIVMDGKGFVATANGCAPSDDWDCKIRGYRGAGTDGLYYVATGPDGRIDAAFEIDMISGEVKIVKKGWADSAYYNYEAMYDSFFGQQTLINAGISQRYGVIANAALVDSMKDISGDNDMGVVRAAGGANGNQTGMQSKMADLIDKYYYEDGARDGATFNPERLIAFWGGASSPIFVFSAGEYKCGVNGCDFTKTQDATFENAMPLLFDGLNHHFMTAAAVIGGNIGASASSEPTFANNNKYRLATYTDKDGDEYAARACGLSGSGIGSGSKVDPWCFAVPALTGEQAVATLAGAVGLLQSAFHYKAMTNEYIFALLALTADGRALPDNVLRGMYQLPADRDSSILTDAEWKVEFDKVFGYGMINLRRATTPNEKLYFNGNKLGKWSASTRSAVAATALSPSTPFGAQSFTISTPVFDFVESTDGESMPRAFDFDFSLSSSVRGSNLSGLLGDISFDKEDRDESITLKLSDDGRDVKNLKIGFAEGGMSFAMGYKQNSASVFSTGNPIMSLAGRAFNATANLGGLSFSAFGGSITDEGLLATDPMLSGEFRPASLGGVYGFDSSFEFGAFKLGAGYMAEDSTTLGMASGGLFSLGGGKTAFANAGVKLGGFTASYTIARTETNPGYGFIESVSDLYSDSYGLSADFGKWSFNISRPLAVIGGRLAYMHTDYEFVKSDNGYDLATDSALREIDLAPEHRETRLSILYRPIVSDRVDLAFGVAGRVNPDNIKGFEQLLVLKFRRVW